MTSARLISKTPLLMFYFGPVKIQTSTSSRTFGLTLLDRQTGWIKCQKCSGAKTSSANWVSPADTDQNSTPNCKHSPSTSSRRSNPGWTYLLLIIVSSFTLLCYVTIVKFSMKTENAKHLNIAFKKTQKKRHFFPNIIEKKITW